MVVVGEVVAAGGAYGVQLVVLEVGELASGGLQGTVELIAGPVHPIDLHHGPQAAFVELLVVSHKGQPRVLFVTILWW